MLPKPYVAGYFDAEGCVQVNKSGYLHVCFGQVNPSVLQRLQQDYGGGLYHKRGRRCNEKDSTTWLIGRTVDAERFLRAVVPYVIEKRPEVELVLQRYSLSMPREEALEIRAELRRLKRRAIVPDDLPQSLREREQDRGRNNCSVDGCEKPARARGLCNMHYLRGRNHGEFQTGPRWAFQPFTYGRRPTQQEKMYTAGYFDGDGCLSLEPRIAISFAQTKPGALLRLGEVYGGVFCLRKPKGRRRPQLAWTLNCREAIKVFLDDVAPYVMEKVLVVKQSLARL